MFVVEETHQTISKGDTTMLATIPVGAIPMTAVITDCQSTVETRIVDQTTGNTIKTDYHNNLNDAVDYTEQFPIDRIEFDTL